MSPEGSMTNKVSFCTMKIKHLVNYSTVKIGLFTHNGFDSQGTHTNTSYSLNTYWIKAKNGSCYEIKMVWPAVVVMHAVFMNINSESLNF